MLPPKTILPGERYPRLRTLLDGFWLPPIIRPVVYGDMGFVCVDRLDEPAVCSLSLSDFVLYAGDAGTPAARYFIDTTERPCYVLPSTRGWEKLVRTASNPRSHTRYTFSHERLEAGRLRGRPKALPDGFDIRRFDEAAVERAASERWSLSFVENFADPADFLERGIGFGVFRGEVLVAAASSFAVYDRTVEIEVDTHPSYRRRGFAAAASARLILACLERDLVPHWDAANEASRALAERLGFTLERRYEVVQL